MVTIYSLLPTVYPYPSTTFSVPSHGNYLLPSPYYLMVTILSLLPTISLLYIYFLLPTIYPYPSTTFSVPSHGNYLLPSPYILSHGNYLIPSPYHLPPLHLLKKISHRLPAYSLHQLLIYFGRKRPFRILPLDPDIVFLESIFKILDLD